MRARPASPPTTLPTTVGVVGVFEELEPPEPEVEVGAAPPPAPPVVDVGDEPDPVPPKVLV